MSKMMAGRTGYQDIQNYSNDNMMSPDYFGLIARGERYYLSHYINVDDGKYAMAELDTAQVAEIQKDWDRFGCSMEFIERWLWMVT